MIEVRDLEKNFGKTQALKGISFQVRQGEISGLVGPDGAGKTTTLRIMAGVLEPSGGDVLLRGNNNGLSLTGKIGYMPQNFSLYEEFSVWENIYFFGSMYGLRKKDLSSEGKEILSMVGLLDFLERSAGNLSGGMKQKLSLACALIHRPTFLILDEPSTGLDPVSRREFWEILYRINSSGITIILSTPYMDEAELCTQLVFLHQGKILLSGSPEEICHQYPWKVLEIRSPENHYGKVLENLPCHDMNSFGETLHIVVEDPGSSIRRIEKLYSDSGIANYSVREITPSLEDIFVEFSRDVSP